MKTILCKVMALAAVAFVVASCAKDNYDMPDQSLTGRIVYNGEPINVEYNQVRIQLWESGWQLKTPIDMAIAPDGTFSAVLFKGDYKMVIPAGQGPFRSVKNDQTQSDTIALTLTGSTVMDLEVMPYYMIRNAKMSAAGNAVSGTFALEKIITDGNAKNIERVYLYVNKTQFVSGANNIKVADKAGADITDPTNISLSVEIPTMVPAQNFIYARVGVKISGVEDLIFSGVQKLSL